MNYTVLYVALGGALGSVARYGITNAVSKWWGTAFPYGTLAVNLLGGLCMGMLAGVLAKLFVPQDAPLRALLAVGFLGGFTTFSAFSLEMVTLWERGATQQLAAYVLLSVLGSFTALMLGLTFVRSMG